MTTARQRLAELMELTDPATRNAALKANCPPHAARTQTN